MPRRALVTALWFASIAFAGEVVWSVAATPRPLGLLVALAVAAFVWTDPFHALHPVTLDRAAPSISTLTPGAAGLPH